MRTLLALAVLMVVFAAACTRGDGKPDSTPETSVLARNAQFLDLPPVDRTCTRDEDCVFGAGAKREGDSCCLGCPSTPVSVSWHRLLLDKCESWNARNTRLTCTKYQCRKRLPVACVDGQCVNK
ncbi:hypothetical protein KKD52_00640 [Myxococcota bacterium]|nr:hypothetical protein [Myxococcota bacterium]MBU1413798.1 hypothetical protein [Myxococcota bacterium]MBU1508838.1 hypothetical protein [Myxococcota bacterium]